MSLDSGMIGLVVAALLASGGALVRIQQLMRSVADQGRRLGTVKSEQDYNRGWRDCMEGRARASRSDS